MSELGKKVSISITGASVAIASLLGVSSGSASANEVNDHFSSGFKGEGGSSSF